MTYTAELNFCWPQVFINGNYNYNDPKQALADAYSGWGLCSAGADIPENFGKGMVFIAEYLRIPNSLEEELNKLKKILLKEK